MEKKKSEGEKREARNQEIIDEERDTIKAFNPALSFERDLIKIAALFQLSSCCLRSITSARVLVVAMVIESPIIDKLSTALFNSVSLYKL